MIAQLQCLPRPEIWIAARFEAERTILIEPEGGQPAAPLMTEPDENQDSQSVHTG